MRPSTSLYLVALLAGAHAIQSFAQVAPVEPVAAGDTIAERAAWTLEQQRAKNAPQPVTPAPVAAPAPPAISQQQRAGIAPDSAVTGIRGFAESLEASFLLNGKRAVGSLKYPTLVDGWKLVEITASGATIEQTGKNKDRKQLTFSGVVPFQQGATMNAGQTGVMPLPMSFTGSPPVFSSGTPLPRQSPLPAPGITTQIAPANGVVAQRPASAVIAAPAR